MYQFLASCMFLSIPLINHLIQIFEILMLVLKNSIAPTQLDIPVDMKVEATEKAGLKGQGCRIQKSFACTCGYVACKGQWIGLLMKWLQCAS